MLKVAVIMGSDSDLDTMAPCVRTLREFGIEHEVKIISAHRTPRAAEAFESLIDQHAKQLALRLHRHIADLIEQQRAGVRLFEHADLARAAVWAFFAEDFTLHAFRRDGGGVDCDESGVGAR